MTKKKTPKAIPRPSTSRASSQPNSQPKVLRTFSLKQREDLGDARLVLETAVHNLRAAAGTVIDPVETARTMTEQTIVTLRRVRDAMG